MFLWTRTVSTTPLEKKKRWKAKFFYSMSENGKKASKEPLPLDALMDTQNADLKTLSEKIPPVANIFSLYFRKSWKILNVSKLSFCPKKFQWTRRMQFRQIRSKNSTENREVFAHCPKVMKKPNLPKKCFPQIFLLTRSMEFWRTCRKPCQRNQQKPIRFHSISKNYRKTYIFRKKISSDFSYGQPV